MKLKVIIAVVAVFLLTTTIMAGMDSDINDFRLALNNSNVKEFKRIIAPGGLILVRTYNQNRGQDILFRTTDIPAEFQIGAPSGMPFDLRYLFGKTLRAKDVAVLETRISGLAFNDGSITAIRGFCQKVLGVVSQKGRGFIPTAVSDGQYLVLTEADVNNGMLSGSVAVFMKAGTSYGLKAIIDLR